MLSKLLSHPLFLDTDENFLRSVIEPDLCVVTFAPGNVIFSSDRRENRLGFLLRGEATVFSDDPDRSVILRTLRENDLFGAATLFSEEKFVSNIVAATACTVGFLSAEAMKTILEGNTTIMLRYLAFLTQRIRLLNKRIACFTAGSAERRLALYLDSLCEDGEHVTLTTSFSSLADTLDIGRASLYRAMENLERDGFLRRCGKKITLLRRTPTEKTEKEK